MRKDVLANLQLLQQPQNIHAIIHQAHNNQENARQSRVQGNLVNIELSTQKQPDPEVDAPDLKIEEEKKEVAKPQGP